MNLEKKKTRWSPKFIGMGMAASLLIFIATFAYGNIYVALTGTIAFWFATAIMFAGGRLLKLVGPTTKIPIIFLLVYFFQFTFVYSIDVLPRQLFALKACQSKTPKKTCIFQFVKENPGQSICGDIERLQAEQLGVANALVSKDACLLYNACIDDRQAECSDIAAADDQEFCQQGIANISVQDRDRESQCYYLYSNFSGRRTRDGVKSRSPAHE